MTWRVKHYHDWMKAHPEHSHHHYVTEFGLNGEQETRLLAELANE